MKFDVKGLLASFIGMLLPLIPVLGSNALTATERAATVPEKDVRKLCNGMSEADKVTAVQLFRKVADAISDAVVFVASRGKIKPD